MDRQDGRKVTFEEALNEAGFGLYSVVLLSLSGLIIISLVCIAYASTIIVPASACELETTTSQKGLLAAVPVIALLLGAVPWGYLTDIYGRKRMLIILLSSSAVFNGLASISVNWIMLLILQFLSTFFSSGQFSQAMSILSESVPMANRNIVVLLVGSIFLLSQGIMALMAIPIIPLSFSYYMPTLGIYWNSWRSLLLLYSAPSLISIIGLLFISESPKFLFNKGLEREALSVVSRIHKINNIWSKKEFPVLDIQRDRPQTTETKTALTDTFSSLFKRPLLKNTIILSTLFLFQQVGSFVLWLPTVSNQFVRILETGEGSDLTLCAIIRSSINTPPDTTTAPCALNVTSLLLVLSVSALQSIANGLISLIINRTGRRNVVICVTAFCGIAGILVNFVPNAIGSAVLYIVFLIGIVALGLYSAIAVALFPTYLRALAVAFTMTIGRIGTFVSVQVLNRLLNDNCEISFYIYGGIFASSAIVAAFLVDDRQLQPKKILE
nr:putative transporter svop-1 isoform X1 [Danaus plexippus plexippus]